MAGTVLLLRPLIISRHFPVQTRPPKSPSRLKPNPTRFRARNPLRSSPEQNPNPLEETPKFSFSFRSVSGLLERIRDDGISLEILYIALPAALGLAADPLASLVDTAFVGHIGSVELAAVGVSASLFNLVSKLFNIPLLNITTSFVAEQQARDNNSEGEGGLARESMDGRKYMPAVSTSLALAAGIGILETVALTLGSGTLMNFMGFAYSCTR